MFTLTGSRIVSSFWSSFGHHLSHAVRRQTVLNSISAVGYVKSTVITNGKKKFKENDIDLNTLDPDKFGDLGEKYDDNYRRTSLKAEDCKDDADGYDRLEIKRGLKRSIKAYMRMFRELKTEKPINVAKMLKLHREFIYEDRYIPDRIMYTLLISACAQVGYTHKAIELFREMKQFQLKPTRATVTSLFNSCANCSHTAKYGLEQALILRKQLELDGYEYNELQYNAMIKAFARLGDMRTAQITLQEMSRKKLSINLDTYAMLLMGCITDKHEGLFEASLLFGKILQSGVTLDVYVFNLLLRCIRDCQLSQESLLRLCSARSELESNQSNKQDNATLSKPQTIVNLEVDSLSCSKDSVTVLSANQPNLLTGHNLSQVISIDYKSLSLPKNRLLLFGGLQGFLDLMDSKSVKPNIKTLTLIIDLLDTKDCLAEVTQLVKRYHIKPDIFLYNVMLKKAAKNKDEQLCQEILQRMQLESIQPDIMTFGALAFGCKQLSDARRLLTEMAQFDIVPNQQIMGNLINEACYRQDIRYLLFLLNQIEQRQLSLSQIDIEQIDLLVKKIKQHIMTDERNNLPVNSKLNDQYTQLVATFSRMVKSVTVKDKPHAWNQFESDEKTKSPGKKRFNTFVRYMNRKMDVKHGREKKEEPDYNDIIDP